MDRAHELWRDPERGLRIVRGVTRAERMVLKRKRKGRDDACGRGLDGCGWVQVDLEGAHRAEVLR